uniref:Uncharacterized protein n=1 Tax=Romanomermis culicivorax TaxID=13658 RepID=A0A915IL49_ROMCU
MNTNNEGDSMCGVFSINGDIICEFVGHEAIAEFSSKLSEQCNKCDSTSVTSVRKSSTSDSQATKHQVKSIAIAKTKRQIENKKFKSKSDSALTLTKGALLRKGGFMSDLLDLPPPYYDNSQSTMGIRSDVISSDQLTLVQEWRGDFVDKRPTSGREINCSKTNSQYSNENEQNSRIVRRDKSAIIKSSDQRSSERNEDELINECENGRESATVESCSNVVVSYDGSVPMNDEERWWMPCHFHAPYASLCHHIL